MPELGTAVLTYAEVVAERDSPHCGKTMTRSFRDVLRALIVQDSGRVHDLARAAGTDWAGAFRVLERMRRLGLVTYRPVPGVAPGARDGRHYSLTEDGHDLARTTFGPGNNQGENMSQDRPRTITTVTASATADCPECGDPTPIVGAGRPGQRIELTGTCPNGHCIYSHYEIPS
jgi:DNA-binding MarR family transcriptional regulator